MIIISKVLLTQFLMMETTRKTVRRILKTQVNQHNKNNQFIIIVQTMIGALAARNNLRVKNARQPVERKDV